MDIITDQEAKADLRRIADALEAIAQTLWRDREER